MSSNTPIIVIDPELKNTHKMFFVLLKKARTIMELHKGAKNTRGA
jgi:hypothetical protein